MTLHRNARAAAARAQEKLAVDRVCARRHARRGRGPPRRGEAGARPVPGLRLRPRDSLSDAVQVLDAFHIVKLGTQVVDEVRRRVQQGPNLTCLTLKRTTRLHASQGTRSKR